MSAARAAIFLILLLSAAGGPGGPAAVHAQDPNRAVDFEDLGFTEPGEVGARAQALRASAALFGDVLALAGNNAGLARAKRLHGTVVFDHERSRTGLDYGAGATGADVSATRLAFAGTAYPLPVLRGSFVPAIAVQRAFSSDLSLAYTRDNTADGRAENFALEQNGATWAWALGLGMDLSPTLSAGASAFLLSGGVEMHRRYDWEPLVPDPTEHTYVIEDGESDVSGYGAQIGVQLFFHRRLRLGFRFNAPTVVKVKSTRVREETRQVDNDIGSFLRETSEEDMEYILPHRVSGAVAVPLSSLLLTAHVDYADWSAAAIDGRRIYTQDTDTVFEHVFGYGGGVEWSLDSVPLRLRAGFDYAPAPLKYLQTDRIDNDRLVRVDAQSGRTRFSAGAGVLLFSRVVVDAAWEHTSGSRETAAMNDEYSATRLSLQVAYWF